MYGAPAAAGSESSRRLRLCRMVQPTVLPLTW